MVKSGKVINNSHILKNYFLIAPVIAQKIIKPKKTPTMGKSNGVKSEIKPPAYPIVVETLSAVIVKKVPYIIKSFVKILEAVLLYRNSNKTIK